MKELREAIDDVEFSIKCCCEVDTKHLLILSDLAERYLASADTMPSKCEPGRCHDDAIACSAYNQAVEECTIVHLKIVDGLEQEKKHYVEFAKKVVEVSNGLFQVGGKYENVINWGSDCSIEGMKWLDKERDRLLSVVDDLNAENERLQIRDKSFVDLTNELMKRDAEIERLAKRDCNATVKMCYDDGDNPFAKEELGIVDVGVADNVYVVESSLFKSLQAENAQLRKEKSELSIKYGTEYSWRKKHFDKSEKLREENYKLKDEIKRLKQELGNPGCVKCFHCGRMFEL